MVFDAKEIGALRAAIPSEYQPPLRHAGRLASYFSSVDAPCASTALQGSALTERDRHNLGAAVAADDDATTPGFMLTGAHANTRIARLGASEQRKRNDERRYVIQQIISQIEARNRQIEENLRRYAELERREAALQDHLERLRRGEKPALDVDGKLRNDGAEAAIREYEERYGVKVDRADAAQIGLILGGIRDEKLRIVRDNEDLAADNERDRQLALDMGADPASIPATVAKLESTASGQRSTNLITANLQSEEQRRAVVDTIFAGDDRALGREAIAEPDEGFDEIVGSDGIRQTPGSKPPTPK